MTVAEPLPAGRPSRWSEPAATLLTHALRGDSSLVRALSRLRWISLVAQVATVGTVSAIWSAPLPLVPLAVVWLLCAASNLVLMRQRERLGERRLAAVLLLDVALLTAALAWTGGPANPFSVLYLLLVMLAAIVGSPRLSWLVTLASSVGFGGLFFFHVPLPHILGGHSAHGAHGSYSAHLQGMWLAHVLSAAAIAAFVSALSRALYREREKSERTARLLGLTTLAAGAAHEIGNPLGTIRLAVSELTRDLKQKGLGEEELSDLRLIDSEVGRARRVLDGLAASAGELMGECPVPAELSEVVQAALDRLEEQSARVQVTVGSSLRRVCWPVQAVAQALLQLLRNALQADPEARPVQLRVSEKRGGVHIEVLDRGPGMSSEVLERLGEPFFTTRPGEGMGLGVFIARSLVEHLGGSLSFQSNGERGTASHLWLPAGVAK